MKDKLCRTLDEAFDCYGEDNLVPISFIKQIVFYVRHGVQPRFICEKENAENKIVCWFLKSETQYVHKKWKDSYYDSLNDNGKRIADE